MHADRGVQIDASELERIAAVTFPTSRLVHGQIDRARGLAGGDAALMRRALATFATSGARPAEARVRVELSPYDLERGRIVFRYR